MTDDKLSAALDKMRNSHRQHISVNYPAPGICVSRCAERYPCAAARAVAALDAVLKLAGGWKQEAGHLDKMAGHVTDSLRRQVLGLRAQACDDHSTSLDTAISRALLGGNDG
jgi:hypothetical protein